MLVRVKTNTALPEGVAQLLELPIAGNVEDSTEYITSTTYTKEEKEVNYANIKYKFGKR